MTASFTFAGETENIGDVNEIPGIQKLIHQEDVNHKLDAMRINLDEDPQVVNIPKTPGTYFSKFPIVASSQLLPCVGAASARAAADYGGIWGNLGKSI